jgi:hypothetical protein
MHLKWKERRENKRREEILKQPNSVVNNKLLLKEKTPQSKTMNIHSNDNQYLSQDDARKLDNYKRVDFGNLNVGDHFRYTLTTKLMLK